MPVLNPGPPSPPLPDDQIFRNSKLRDRCLIVYDSSFPVQKFTYHFYYTENDVV